MRVLLLGFAIWGIQGMAATRSPSDLQTVPLPGGREYCETFQIHQPLKVFRDRSFLEDEVRKMVQEDEDTGPKNRAVLTTLRGEATLQILGYPKPFRGFDAIAGMFGLGPDYVGSVGRAPKVIPIRECRTGAYGFVVEKDLIQSRQERRLAGQGMPPSTYPNPIPEWKP
ncbi:hypothetical protein K2X33_16025 [bacterium]|nr:hypothetical protein [bacterium]